MLRVAVIGAGMAGLSCAARLAEAGCRVDVFEKSRGTGGRLATRRDHGTGFDLGAQYFTARDPRFIACVEAWEEAGTVARWEVVPWLLEAQGKVLPSPDDTPRWVGVPGMSSLAHRMLGRETVLCTQSTITAIERRAGRWCLHAGDTLRYEDFSAVVVAVPAPQAAALVAGSPLLMAAVQAAVMEPCWVVAIGYERPTGIDLDAAFARGQPVSWLARNSSKPQRQTLPEVWLLHAAPMWSEEHLEAPADAVARNLYRWFAGIFPRAAGEPLWLHAHRWRFARSAHELPDGHRFDASLQLGICGDWCNGGRVEGAWLSGRALADALIAAHRL
ncbi:MAG: NAD(P)/FAD-dependent oxidoreductase [Pseudomonadota bacterium]